jgi:hypothetical protein
VGELNTPLSSTDRSSKQKINGEIQELNHSMDQMDLANVYIIFHPNYAQYKFSAAHRTFSKIYLILRCKANLCQYKKIEIILCILTDHNALKPEINNKNSSKKHVNNWKQKNTLLNHQWVIDEIKEEIKRFLEVNENEKLLTRTYGTQQVTPKRKV